MNDTMLQLVAQLPSHPFQKLALELLEQRPKSVADAHSKSAEDDAAITAAASMFSIFTSV